jgi:hypothetical protein
MPIFYYFVGLLLQALPTREGWQYLKGASGDDAEKADFSKQHLSTDEFHKKFYESDLGQDIRERLDAPGGEAPATLKSLAKVRFQNSWYQSLKLLVQRETLLWWRDKYQIQAKLGKFLLAVLYHDKENVILLLTLESYSLLLSPNCGDGHCRWHTLLSGASWRLPVCLFL